MIYVICVGVGVGVGVGVCYVLYYLPYHMYMYNMCYYVPYHIYASSRLAPQYMYVYLSSGDSKRLVFGNGALTCQRVYIVLICQT